MNLLNTWRMKTAISILVYLCIYIIRAQEIDSSTLSHPNKQDLNSESKFFRNFAGSLNGLIQNNQSHGSFDLQVETYHYYIVTGRKYKNDSIHSEKVACSNTLMDCYKGVHVFLMNRAAIDFDSLRTMANNYLTSLLGSPLTLRLSKEFFIGKNRSISQLNFAPVLSLLLVGDGRLIPYSSRESKISIGASTHLYAGLMLRFKRIEFDQLGRMTDEGIMYLKPLLGVAVGTDEMMKSVSQAQQNKPLLSSGCKIGFTSQRQRIKDFSFLLSYAHTPILGPRLRFGLLLGGNSMN